MQFFVKTLTGITLSFDIEPSNTIHDLKLLIEYNGGIHADLQRLVFTGKQLEDDRKLTDYGVQSDSIVHLFLNLKGGGFKVNIQELSENITELNVEASDQIEQVMFKIQDALGIPPDQQRLIFKGRQLDANHTLSDYGVQAEDKILLVPRLRGC